MMETRDSPLSRGEKHMVTETVKEERSTAESKNPQTNKRSGEKCVGHGGVRSQIIQVPPAT